MITVTLFLYEWFVFGVSDIKYKILQKLHTGLPSQTYARTVSSELLGFCF